MFLNFGIKNYRSIGDELKIDFSIAKSQRLGAFTDLGGLGINKIACLVGPNASGKSNILRGIVHFLSYMCRSYARPDLRNIPLTPHFCCASKPAEFSVEFIEKDVQYEYVISLLNNVVQQESLKRYNPNTKRYKSVFTRELNEVKHYDMEINKSDLSRLTEDISLFSLLLWSNYWGKESFLGLKNNILSNVQFGLSFAFQNPFEKVANITKKLRLDKFLLEELIDELKAIDTGISGLRLEKVQAITQVPVDKEAIKQEIETLFTLHCINGDNYSLHLLDESAGTVNFIGLFTHLYNLLRNGGILIADELEQSLHPDITGRILNIFLDRDKNPNNAQLLFTTHNPWFLQDLTKTQIIITEKNERGETEITRLDEIRGVRNDENYFLKYINGEYDGKPRIKEL